MQVTLRRPFVVDGLRYRVAPKGSFTTMPDHLRGRLPKTAVIHEGPVAAPEKEKERDDGVSALRAADPQRATSESSDEDALKAAGMAGLVEVDKTEEAGDAAKHQTSSDKRSAKAQAANRTAKKAAKAARAEEALKKVNDKKLDGPTA